jgi:hypothetical protein
MHSEVDVELAHSRRLDTAHRGDLETNTLLRTSIPKTGKPDPKSRQLAGSGVTPMAWRASEAKEGRDLTLPG